MTDVTYTSNNQLDECCTRLKQAVADGELIAALQITEEIRRIIGYALLQKPPVIGGHVDTLLACEDLVNPPNSLKHLYVSYVCGGLVSRSPAGLIGENSLLDNCRVSRPATPCATTERMQRWAEDLARLHGPCLYCGSQTRAHCKCASEPSND